MRNNLVIANFREFLKGLRRLCSRRRKSDATAAHASTAYLEAGYREMAADAAREAEAKEWAEALVGDFDAE